MMPDRTRPEHDSYRLMFRQRTAGGGGDDPLADPMDHRIEVVADMARRCRLKTRVHHRPQSRRMRKRSCAVRAVDPDFG